MSDVNVVSQNPTDVAVPRFREAYDRLLDEIKKVPSGEIVPINIDIPSAVFTTLGALPEIVALRPRIAAMSEYDIASFDKLEAYALAVGYAHGLWLLASQPAESIDELSQEGVQKREVLFKDASALAQRHLIDGQKLKELKGPVGFRNLTFDLIALSALLRNSWSAIQGKTALTLAEIDQVQVLADRLATAVGVREQGPAIVAEAAAIRQQAFTLFVNAYDLARRAVIFLRWNEGDADDIAPSLYAGRNTGKRKNGTDTQPAVPTTPVAPATPAAPVASPVTNAAVAPRSVGLPNSEPFLAR